MARRSDEGQAMALKDLALILLDFYRTPFSVRPACHKGLSPSFLSHFFCHAIRPPPVEPIALNWTSPGELP